MGRRQLYRDGLLAAAACAALVGVSLRWGVGGVLRNPAAVAVGCVGMAAVEVGLLRVPDLTRRVWERPGVQAGSAVGVALVGWLAVAAGAAWILGVLVWGLVAYVVLAGVVLTTGRNPLARFAG